jgi:hypothetical protein
MMADHGKYASRLSGAVQLEQFNLVLPSPARIFIQSQTLREAGGWSCTNSPTHAKGHTLILLLIVHDLQGHLP